MSNLWPRGQKLPERNQKGPNQDRDWRNRRPATYENQHPHAIAKRKRSYDARGDDRSVKWARGQTPAGEGESKWSRGRTPAGEGESKWSRRRTRRRQSHQSLFSIAYINLQDVGIDESKLEAKIELAKKLLAKADGLFVSEIWTQCREEESEFVQRMKAEIKNLFVRSQTTTGVHSNCHVVYFFSTGDKFRCLGDKYCTPNAPVPRSDAYDRFLPIVHTTSRITIIGLHAYVEHSHDVITKCLTMVKQNFIVMGDFNLRWTTLLSDHVSDHRLVLSNKKWDHIITSKDFSHGVKTSVIKSDGVSDHNAIKITVFN